MNFTYKFIFDTAYSEVLIERYYRQLPWILHLRVQFSIVFALCAAAWLILQWPDISWVAMLTVPALAVVGMLGCVHIVQWGILMKIKGKRDFGLEAIITMSEQGLNASGGSFKNDRDWSAYQRSVRFPDGILLRRPGVIRWLPDTALQDGAQTKRLR